MLSSLFDSISEWITESFIPAFKSFFSSIFNWMSENSTWIAMEGWSSRNKDEEEVEANQSQ